MDLMDLEKYIGNVEARITRALSEVEKRIGTMISSTENRFDKSTNDLDECVRDIKRQVGKMKTAQLTCDGHKEITDLSIEFKSHKEGHVETKQVNDLESNFKGHVEGHKKIKEYKEFGITKFRVYTFIFFAFVAMGISIWNAFFKGG